MISAVYHPFPQTTDPDTFEDTLKVDMQLGPST
jgi:hypothetical protein